MWWEQVDVRALCRMVVKWPAHVRRTILQSNATSVTRTANVETWTDEDGIAWVSCGSLTVGDYGGAGSVGEANIRCLKEREDCRIKFGAYYSRQAWLLDTEENRELVEGLVRDYPLIDEEEMSRVEMEWEEEAWTIWLQDDLNATLPDELGEVIGDEIDSGEQWDLYRRAMDMTNTYPAPEYSNVHVDVDRIKDTYAQLVLARLGMPTATADDEV